MLLGPLQVRAQGPIRLPLRLGQRRPVPLRLQLDRPGGEPARSLRYFAGPLEEVRTESFPASYWRHLEFNLRRCERVWRDRTAEAGSRARPDLEQASPPSKSREASSATAVGDQEETG